MDNLFGRSLRGQMEKAGVKESELAAILGYDATYISKWINGSKLPSQRNAERVIEQMVNYLIQRMKVADETDREELRQDGMKELHLAYGSDSSYLALQGYTNSQMSFMEHQQTLIQLTREALLQALNMSDGCICIMATFDFFGLYGKSFKKLLQELKAAGVKRVELKLALDPNILAEKPGFYATYMTSIIGDLNYIEMSIVSQKPEEPHILVINDLLCVQLLWNCAGELAAVFSMDKKMVMKFSNMCRQILEGSDSLLDPANPDQLKRTNVQLDSYSDNRQWLFFNEPPAMLFPEEIMDAFIKDTSDEDYAGYLMKLKNIFKHRTCKTQIDLVFFSSMLNKYLSDGITCVGNMAHQLTKEQTYQHIRYLSEVMTRNPNFHIYVIRDTVVLNEELRKSPSIFIDSQSVYIENSKKTPNDNFHISMHGGMRHIFQKQFENLLLQPYCTKLTAEDLLRYL